MSGRMLTRVYVGHPTGPLAGQTDTDTFTYDRNGRMLSGIKVENKGSGLFCAKHPKGLSGKRGLMSCSMSA